VIVDPIPGDTLEVATRLEEQDLPRAHEAAERALAALTRARMAHPLGHAQVKVAGSAHQRALQVVSKIKARIKTIRRANMGGSTAPEREKHERAFGEHFLDVARELLDPDVFTTLMREATLRKTRALVRYEGNGASGAALGARGGASGFHLRKEDR
jgi:hypothetical protein